MNLVNKVRGCCGAVVSMSAWNAGDMGLIPVGTAINFPPQGSMAGICNPTCMGEGKMLWEESHSSGSYGAYVMQHCLGLDCTIGGAGSL